MPRTPAAPRRVVPGTVAALFLLCAAAVTARSQCPDGTPPPCNSAATSAVRRPSLALNARAWVVVPFGNAMRAQELDWLRDGSANLLSLDMGRWSDIDVVPDKRVGDLVRELSGSRSAEALTLDDGLAVARRAGAGKLVMGDFFRVGKGARIVANVFDVKTGARVRTVTQQATDADSVLTAFAPLARAVLAVPPPADAKIGDVGTTSLDAYRAYLLGVKALNRFDLPEAQTRLARALALDSTFALAHLEYSLLLGWTELSGSNQAKVHALAAQRLGASLPKRERLLIEAGVAMAASEYGRLCTIARSLIAQDSTDIQGVFFLGECSFHDDTVIPSTQDSTIGTFRGSWETAKLAFTRVIDLDPTYLGAFEHVLQILQRTIRSVGCPPAGIVGAPCSQWIAYVLRSGDTLEVVPTRAGSPATVARERRFRAEKPLVGNRREAVSIARRWIDADPSSEGAHFGLARISLLSGDLATADAELKRIPSRATVDNFDALRLKFEVAAKRGRGAEARAMFDSAVKAIPDAPGILATRGGMELIFGRLARFDRAGAAAAARIGPEAGTYQRHVARALLGVPKDGMARDEAAFFSSMRDSSCNDECRLARVRATLVYVPHTPVGSWPVLVAGTAGDNNNYNTPRALARSDTAQLRRAAQQSEGLARDRIAAGTLETGFSVTSAHAFLLLGDSVSALRMARFFVDTSMASLSFSSSFITSVVPLGPAPFVPRMMLLRADLAAAAGQQEEARVWYARVLDLWADADAELQPTVARIRAAVNALPK